MDDAVLDLAAGGSTNDLDVYLFRIESGGALTLIGSSFNSPGDESNRETIVSSPAAGTYVIAIQAWDTPTTDSVDYWYIIR